MRVVIDAAPLLGSPTGVGAMVDGLLGALANNDDPTVDAYALSGRGAAGLASVLPTGIGQVNRPMPASLLARIWGRLDYPLIEHWTGGADVVHGTNFVVPPTRHAGQLVTVHDLTAIHFPQMCAPATLRYPKIIRRAIDRGAHVHTPSQAIADEVCDAFRVESDRVHAIAPGVPATRAVSPKRTDRYILCLGTIEPRKDHATLVRAFDMLASRQPDVTLVIAGSNGWAIDAFEQAMTTAANSGRIERLGRVSDADRNELLAGASVLAYPSVYEGFGLPPLEAMQAGVPVVATRAGAVPETVGDAAVLVEAGDVDELAAAMARALEDQDLRQSLVSAGKARAASFTWQRMASEMTDLYRLLAKETR